MPIQRGRVRENRGGNWFWLHNAIIERYAARIGVYGLAVYVCLCRHVNDDQETWIKQGTIARELGCSDRQVRRVLDELVSAGLIAIEEQRDDSGYRATNIYTLLRPPDREPAGDARLPDSRSAPADSQSERAGPGVRAMKKTHGTRTKNKTPLPFSYERYVQQ